MQGAADAHTLDSPTSERLQLGLMAFAGSALAVHLVHGELAGWCLVVPGGFWWWLVVAVWV